MQNRGLEKVASRKIFHFAALSAACDFGAGGDSLSHHTLVFLQLRSRGHGTELCARLPWVAQNNPIRTLDQALDKMVIHWLLDVGSRPRHAGLARGSEDSAENTRLRLLQICIRKNDGRALPAKLQSAACQPAACLFCYPAPSIDTSGKRNLGD